MKTIFIPFKLDEANPTGGGGGGGGTPTTTTNTPNPTDEAAKERERILSENAELRKKQKAAEDKANAAAEELAALKKAGAKGSGDWQKVAETLETELTSLKASNVALKEGFKNTLVSSRVREEALKQGAKQDMVDLLDSMDFDEVEFSLDETNLKFNVKGVDTAISNLKKLRPSFFDLKQPPKFNAGGPGGGGGGGAVGLEGAKANYLAALKNRAKDPATFNKAHAEYQQELQKARKGN